MARKNANSSGRRRGNSRPSQARQPRGLQQASFNPPTVVTAPPQRMRLRFVAPDNSSVRVTRACLLNLAVSTLANATGAGSVVPSFTGVKLNRLSVWQGGNTLGSGVSTVAAGVDVVWLSDLGQDVRLTRSYLGGPSAALITRPPRQSRAGFWSRADSAASSLAEILFVINATSPGTAIGRIIIDVDLSVTRGDAEILGGSALAGAAVVAYTGGPTALDNGLYYTPLDNISPANSVGFWLAVPVGVTMFSAAAPTTWVRTDA